MSELRSLREGWGEFEAEEVGLLRGMSIQESARQLLMLQKAFEPQFRQTAALYAHERWAALAELQARLHRLTEYQEQHGIAVPRHSNTAEASEG